MHGELIEWGGTGPVVHVAHANGFPPGAYGRMIEALTDRARLVSWRTPPLREGSDPGAVRGWEDLAADLGAGLCSAGLGGIVGVGHSMGAVISVMAAVEHPGLFRGLVLVDPVFFTGWLALFWGATKALGRVHRFRLVRGARRRRERWPSRAAVLDAWRNRPPFSRWAPGVLEDYVQHGFVEDGGGVRLAYPKAWEARLFELTPHDPWNVVRRLSIPVLALRGERSDTFLRTAARRLRRVLPRAKVVEVPGTSHFVPMEEPEVVAAAVRGFLEELG